MTSASVPTLTPLTESLGHGSVSQRNVFLPKLLLTMVLYPINQKQTRIVTT